MVETAESKSYVERTIIYSSKDDIKAQAIIGRSVKPEFAEQFLKTGKCLRK